MSSGLSSLLAAAGVEDRQGELRGAGEERGALLLATCRATRSPPSGARCRTDSSAPAPWRARRPCTCRAPAASSRQAAHEARLADSGRPLDRHDAAAALDGGGERLVERLQLGLAFEQIRVHGGWRIHRRIGVRVGGAPDASEAPSARTLVHVSCRTRHAHSRAVLEPDGVRGVLRAPAYAGSSFSGGSAWPWPWTSAAARRRRTPPGRTGGNLRAVAARRRHPSPDAAVRAPRARRRPARPVRRLGDAGAVRGHPPGARGGAHGARACSTSRTWARSRRAGRRPRTSFSASSRTTSRGSPSAAPSTRSSAARTAACSTTCSPTASATAAS